MLVLKRKAAESELTDAEREELFQLKQAVLNKKYECILENLPGQKSVPDHYHVHLINFRIPEGVDPSETE